MAEVMAFEAGGYRYIRGIFEFSAGVAGVPGFEIERVVLSRLLPLAEGLDAAESHIRKLLRVRVALTRTVQRSRLLRSTVTT